jgi:hypothetical protein
MTVQFDTILPAKGEIFPKPFYLNWTAFASWLGGCAFRIKVIAHSSGSDAEAAWLSSVNSECSE